MHGTPQAPVRERNGIIVLTSNDDEMTVLDATLRLRGYENLRDQADHLSQGLRRRVGIATLSRAYNGGAVSTDLIYAVRIAFPAFRYEHFFREMALSGAAA